MEMESARFAAAMGVRACTMCRLAPPEFERAVASGDYDDEMREMLHLLKFAGRRQLAELVLGERVARAAMMLREAAAKDLIVVPVPLFAARERERGYNQALLLARAAVKRLRKMTPEWRLRIESSALQRVRETRNLYGMSRRQRRVSLRGAFRIAKSEAVRGREVLLVDDIMTTGATARECARVLMRAGAAKVWVATAAKVQPEGSRSEQMEPVEVAMWSPKLVEPDVSRQRRFGGSDG
jgi:ComF family protein